MCKWQNVCRGIDQMPDGETGQEYADRNPKRDIRREKRGNRRDGSGDSNAIPPLLEGQKN